MLAGLDLCQDGFDLAGAIFGSQELCGLADDLRAGVAVHPCGRRVPARDYAVERAADDGVVRTLDDGSHALGGLERLPLLGDVPSLSLIHISEPTRRTPTSYAVFC